MGDARKLGLAAWMRYIGAWLEWLTKAALTAFGCYIVVGYGWYEGGFVGAGIGVAVVALIFYAFLADDAFDRIFSVIGGTISFLLLAIFQIGLVGCAIWGIGYLFGLGFNSVR